MPGVIRMMSSGGGPMFLPDAYLETLRIVNENYEEVDPATLDLNHGKLVEEVVLIEDNPYIPPVEEESYFTVKRFYFTDGTHLDIESEDDPHLKVIDATGGIFDYVDQGEGKELLDLDMDRVIIREGVGEQPAQKIYDTLQVYHPFNEEEQKEFDEYMAKETNKQILLDTGLERLMNTESNIDDMMLLLAEMIGV